MRASSLLLLAILSGCPDRPVAALTPHGEGQDVQRIPATVNRKIDLLFVIDNSGSMKEEQDSLAANFGQFMSVLANIEGGLPSVHIGVVSSNVGAGGWSLDRCGGDGDDGALQTTPRGACAPPAGRFIADEELADGTRQRNYSGTLEETFSCIARLGIDGCGYEQHLEAMRRALDGSRPENAGFLRDDAWLAVVFIADEDDCSAWNTQIFDTAGDANDSALGPYGYRCTEWGVVCDGSPLPRAPGSYELCSPRQESPYLYHPQEYVDFLKGLKPDPRLVIVAGIVGDEGPFSVGYDQDNQLKVNPSCGVDAGQPADPSVRFQHFFDQFPDRARSTSICDANLADALTQIAILLRAVVGSTCLSAAVDLADLHPDAPGTQPECSVLDDLAGAVHVVPRCPMQGETTPDPAGARPCWWVQPDETCDATTSGWAIEVERDVDPPLGTDVVISCATR